MRRFMKKFRRGEKGFTLIELLVVVAILGILAAIVVPNLSTFIGTGANEAACMELKMVQTAVVVYQADHDGTLPSGGSFVDDLVQYFVGTDPVLGTYTIAGDVVTQTDYPGTGGVGCVP